MVFHGDYEEALNDWGSKNPTCPGDIRVGDLVRPKAKWIGFDTIGVYKNSVGIVTDVYKVTHLSGDSWWCCKVYIDGKERALPIGDFELVERR
jgi:hypothetical protein